MFALGKNDPPQVVTLDQREYTLNKLLKHDFFAATAIYESADGKAIVKFGRQASFFALPLSLFGRLLAWRECTIYTVLADMPEVPTCMGRFIPTAFAHDYIEGAHLAKGMDVPDDFFQKLESAIDRLHARGMAYVDLEKRQNVIVSTDGDSYLIDFQISWYWPRKYGGELWPVRWLRRQFQKGDRYHLLKLQRRIRPDQLTPEQIEASYRKPRAVRIHRTLTAPLLAVRRALLRWIDPSKKTGERGALSE